MAFLLDTLIKISIIFYNDEFNIFFNKKLLQFLYCFKIDEHMLIFTLLRLQYYSDNKSDFESKHTLYQI
jgi:hypothetical protein